MWILINAAVKLKLISQQQAIKLIFGGLQCCCVFFRLILMIRVFLINSEAKVVSFFLFQATLLQLGIFVVVKYMHHRDDLVEH